MLVGRRDEPTDGVADYCAWLGGAIGEYGYQLETVRVGWPVQGWRAALADLREQAKAWRGRWVLLQYTTLAWSHRSFPLRAPRILAVLRQSGVRSGVVFHDCSPFVAGGIVGRARGYCQLRVLESLYAQAELAIFTMSLEKISWLPPHREKAVFIPIGANCPELTPDVRAERHETKTVAVYSVTGGAHMLPEVADIGFALKQACRSEGRLRLIVFGRGSREAASFLRTEFAGSHVEVETLGLLSAQDVSRTLARADVLLFVRGHISSRRGSAIAAIACGLPVVGYAGPETGWPVTEAGFVPVPLGDRKGLSLALEKVLSDDALRASLAERSRRAQEQYFSWRAIAARYAETLRERDKGSAGTVATVSPLGARAR